MIIRKIFETKVSKRGCLPEAEARRIFRQITSAVLYCHKVLLVWNFDQS